MAAPGTNNKITKLSLVFSFRHWALTFCKKNEKSVFAEVPRIIWAFEDVINNFAIVRGLLEYFRRAYVRTGLYDEVLPDRIVRHINRFAATPGRTCANTESSPGVLRIKYLIMRFGANPSVLGLVVFGCSAQMMAAVRTGAVRQCNPSNVMTDRQM